MTVDQRQAQDQTHHATHERCVEAWLAAESARAAMAPVGASGNAAATAGGTDRTGTLLLVGLRAMWDRARPSLGDVTLGAIFRRAIETARRRYPALCALELHVTDHGSVEMSNQSAPRVDLTAGVSFLLVELLRVIARLSADALTPALHAALSDARLDDSRWLDPTAPGEQRERVET